LDAEDDTLTLAIWKLLAKLVSHDGGVPVAVCAETEATRARRAIVYCIVVVYVGLLLRMVGIMIRSKGVLCDKQTDSD